MPFQIPGFGPTYFVPKFAAFLVFGAGVISASQQPFYCLLVGQKTTSGSMVSNQDVLQVFQPSDADTAAGVGSQLDLMAEAALQYPGVQVLIAAIPDPSGTAATATAVFSGTATSNGWITVYIGGKNVGVYTINNGTAAAAAGTGLTAFINNAPTNNIRIPVTAAGTTTVTVTDVNVGASGTSIGFYLDLSHLPTGLTCTVTGSATIGSNTPNRVWLGASSSGTGVEDVTTILTVLNNGTRYARIGAGQIDGTNAALWLAQENAKAAPTSIVLEQVHFGQNGTYSTAQTLAKTTLNGVRCSVVWAPNMECHPSVLAASVAAARASNESGNPLFMWDSFPLSGVPALRFNSDLPSDAQQNTALQNGVTPVTNGNGGTAVIIRGITTHCLSGSLADYRTMDWGDVSVPDEVVYSLAGLYARFKQSNPVVAPNPPAGASLPEGGVAYPALWDSQVIAMLTNQYVQAGRGPQPLIEPINETNSQSYLDPATDRIMDSVSVTPLRLNHQLGAQVLQVPPVAA